LPIELSILRIRPESWTSTLSLFYPGRSDLVTV
jgi:hypothetical protein